MMRQSILHLKKGAYVSPKITAVDFLVERGFEASPPYEASTSERIIPASNDLLNRNESVDNNGIIINGSDLF
jgi:hypothetical protein